MLAGEVLVLSFTLPSAGRRAAVGTQWCEQATRKGGRVTRAGAPGVWVVPSLKMLSQPAAPGDADRDSPPRNPFASLDGRLFCQVLGASATVTFGEVLVPKAPRSSLQPVRLYH